jgi:hypothetical protein
MKLTLPLDQMLWMSLWEPRNNLLLYLILGSKIKQFDCSVVAACKQVVLILVEHLDWPDEIAMCMSYRANHAFLSHIE